MKLSWFDWKSIGRAVLVLGLCLAPLAAAAQDDGKSPEVEALFKSAEKNEDAGRLDAALADYGRIIELAPDDGDAYSGRGFIYLKKKDYDRAINDFTKRIELAPDNFYAYYARGHAYFEKGDYEKSIDDHTRELELEARRTVGLIERGRAYQKLKRTDEAIADFNAAIAFSLEPAGYRARGFAFRDKGDAAGAIGDLRYYLAAVPDDSAVRDELLKLGVKALELPAPVLRDDPKIPAKARELFASGIQKFGDSAYDGALADLTAAIDLYPSFAVAYYYRGVVNDAAGSLIYFREINADYTKAIALDPKLAAAYIARAHSQFYNSQKQKSLADLARALALDPKNARAYLYRGIFAQNDARKPADFGQAIRLAPFFAEAYLERAEFYAGRKQYAKALADYDAVLKLNPNEYRVFEGRAAIYCEQGKKELAAENEQKIEALGGQVDFPCADK